jgi:hypothetical protein
MNRLPTVIQCEIWEFVRGDRTFWKTRYETVLSSLPLIRQLDCDAMANLLWTHKMIIDGKRVGNVFPASPSFFLGDEWIKARPDQTFEVLVHPRPSARIRYRKTPKRSNWCQWFKTLFWIH